MGALVRLALVAVGGTALAGWGMAWLHVVLWVLGLGAPAAPPPVIVWAPGPVLDQGAWPACVTFALVSFLEAAPAAVRGPDPLQLYRAAQAQDGAVGPHDGTSVEAALDVLQGQGFVRGWRLTQGLGESLAWLRQRGPIVVEGVCADMLAGVAQRWAACKDPAGVHVWLCYGAGPGAGLACQTSWGALLGRFRWSVAALGRTLADDGRVFLIAKRAPRLRLGVWAD